MFIRERKEYMATNKGRDHNYEKWLKETNKKDTKLNYGWYNCPEEKRSEYIKEHKRWWKNF